MSRAQWPPRPARTVHLALKLAASLGIPEDHALPFVVDMTAAAMRQLPHDGAEGLMWLYQVQAHARTHPTQCRPRSR